MLITDDGYYFGLCAFETIAVENGNPQFLPQHYARLLHTLEFLNLKNSLDEIKEKVDIALTDKNIKQGRKVLKITVSEKNITIDIRTNNYQKEDYEKGFITEFSKIRRNETSPLTYHKTLNYGDCIMEKRLAQKSGIQEPIFLNTKGQISEGATTNVFFIKDRQIIAPPLSCGMLPGIIREYLYQSFEIQEHVISPEDVMSYDEMFLTNSLLGIMPVKKLGNHSFNSMKLGKKLSKEFYIDTQTVIDTNLQSHRRRIL